MDESKGTRPRIVAALIAGALVTGCATKQQETVRTSSSTEIAVSELPADWLRGCVAISADTPKNEVGSLLLDYTELAEAYAESCKRYKNLSDYLKEVVKKERARPANQ